MKYAVEISSGEMTDTPDFIKIGSLVLNLLGGIHIQTPRHTCTDRKVSS
jgi:hypothetical protein